MPTMSYRQLVCIAWTVWMVWMAQHASPIFARLRPQALSRLCAELVFVKEVQGE